MFCYGTNFRGKKGQSGDFYTLKKYENICGRKQILWYLAAKLVLIVLILLREAIIIHVSAVVSGQAVQYAGQPLLCDDDPQAMQVKLSLP